MFNSSRRTAFRTASALLLGFALITTGPIVANADEVSPQGGGVPCSPGIPRITSVKSLSNSTTWPNSSSWRVDGKGPGALSISRALTASNTATATGGASAKSISASVGFSVTKSTTSTTSFSVPLKSGEKRQIQVGAVYQRKSFSWTKTVGCAGTAKTVKGTGTAKNFLRFTYRSVKI